MIFIMRLFALSLLLSVGIANAAEQTPWGGAGAKHYSYNPQKVVYDVNVNTLRAMSGVLDRASFL
ncbi:MAG: hypothetical protein KAU21_02015, partial [Gammaproteobacteria bacterium]|nr:hypothetical protein [Gammaproteobacteria bacterium]